MPCRTNPSTPSPARNRELRYHWVDYQPLPARHLERTMCKGWEPKGQLLHGAQATNPGTRCPQGRQRLAIVGRSLVRNRDSKAQFCQTRQAAKQQNVAVQLSRACRAKHPREGQKRGGGGGGGYCWGLARRPSATWPLIGESQPPGCPAAGGY